MIPAVLLALWGVIAVLLGKIESSVLQGVSLIRNSVHRMKTHHQVLSLLWSIAYRRVTGLKKIVTSKSGSPPPWLSWQGESGVQSCDLDGVGSVPAMPQRRLPALLNISINKNVCFGSPIYIKEAEETVFFPKFELRIGLQ